MLARSRIIFMMLILPICSQALASGSFLITPAQVGSYYEYCAYPLCNPGQGSIQGDLDDGKTLQRLRQDGIDGFSLVISGFTSNPGSGYLYAVRAWCDGPVWFMELFPTYTSYSNGSLYVELYAGSGYTSYCWTSSSEPYATEVITN